MLFSRIYSTKSLNLPYYICIWVPPPPSPCRRHFGPKEDRDGSEGFGGNATCSAVGEVAYLGIVGMPPKSRAATAPTPSMGEGIEAGVALLIVITGCVGVALTRATSHRVYRPADPDQRE